MGYSVQIQYNCWSIWEYTPMSENSSKKQTKRLSKSKRAHVRKLKQAAREAGAMYKPEAR
jgi:hypothetical protein